MSFYMVLCQNHFHETTTWIRWPCSAIHGLKQVLRAWFSELSSCLIFYRFFASKLYLSLFIMHTTTAYILILVYIDNMIIKSSSSLVADNLIHSLSLAFSVKHLGSLSYFLSIQFDYLSNGVFLSKKKYIFDLLAKTGMINAKPTSSPMAASPLPFQNLIPLHLTM